MVVDSSFHKGSGSGSRSWSWSWKGNDGLGIEMVKDVVSALRKAHPYEVAAVGVVEILDV